MEFKNNNKMKIEWIESDVEYYRNERVIIAEFTMNGEIMCSMFMLYLSRVCCPSENAAHQVNQQKASTADFDAYHRKL